MSNSGNQTKYPEEGRDEIDVVKSWSKEVLENIGHTFEPSGQNYKTICGLHAEKTASLFLYPDDCHLHCYGCGFHGDLFDYLRESGIASHFPGAVQFAKESIGQIEGFPHAVGALPAKKAPARERIANSEDPFNAAVVDAYSAFSEAVRHNDPVLSKYAAELGIRDLATLNDRLGKITGCLGLHKGQLAILGCHGMKVRPLAGQSDTKFFVVGKIEGPWRSHRISENTEIAYILEGESDALVAVESGMEDDGKTVVTAVPGCTSFRAEWAESYAQKNVVICMDFDAPGQAAVEVIAPVMSAVAQSVSVVRREWKEGEPKDIREVYLRHGQATVIDILRSATPWIPNPSRPESDLPEIQLPGDNQTLRQFSIKVGDLVSDKNLYLRAGRLVILNQKEDDLRHVDAQAFRTLIERYGSLYQMRQTKEGPLKVERSMTHDAAQAVCGSPDFLERISIIKHFRPVRMPFMLPTGEIILPSEGYDKELEMLTVAGPKINENMSVSNARNVLLEGIKDFPFASEENRVRAIAEGFAVYCKGLLSTQDLQPAWLHQANAPGVGKTTLALLCAAPYLRTPVQSAPKSENDWQKVFTTLLHSGLEVAIFDNIKGHLESEALEAYLSSPTYMGRELGYSRFMEGPASATLIFSGNGNTASRDLLRRSIIVELRTDLLRPEDREFSESLDAQAIQKELPSRMAAMWAIVKDWDKAGRPLATHSNNAFPRWFKIFGGIMEHAEFGMLTAKDARAEEMVDSETHDIEALVDLLEVGKPHTFDHMTVICMREGLFTRQTDGQIGGKLSVEANSSLGKVFAKFDGRIISGKIYRVEGAGRKRRFFVENL